jgi:hypothetical protein
MKHERGTLLPQPRSLGGELLPLHHVAEGDGVEGATRNNSGNISSPILAVFISVLCIMCFSTALSLNRPRVPLYSRFVGQEESLESNIALKQRTGGSWAPPRDQEVGPCDGPSFPPRCVPIDSSSHNLLIPKK